MTGSVVELDKSAKTLLLTFARRALVATASHHSLPQPSPETPAALLEKRACFVTLYQDGELRGCTGVLVARQSLVNEVIETAASTATSDPRFPPVTPQEAARITIEISVLTAPQQLSFGDPAELPMMLRPHIDGVTLHIGRTRGTFLPQVWHKIPVPIDFLGRLCEKMGISYRAWMSKDTRVETYQVEEFSEVD